MIGKTISHYKILEKLGEGGMGVVYKAEDTKLKRTVALKFLPKEYTKDKKARERFKREAQSAAALNHPNIVTIHEINEYEDQTYMAMEYVEGNSLRDEINKGPLPSDQIREITTQICAGLKEAHQADIVHRDIKPENILIDKSGRVKILDFGLAQMKGVSKLTKEATTLGTLRYMSPEQYQNKDVDLRSDIWSFGVVLFEMMTGQLPFEGDYEAAVMYSVVNEEPGSASSLRKGIPIEFEKIINKALEKDPAKRYQGMKEVMEELRQSLTAKPESKEHQKSIIVLPFDDMSPDKDNEYFSDGLTEEIITDLSHIHDLLVISRSSAMTFKGKDKRIKEIAEEVNVQYVLEGSVRKAGNNLRITAQLIEAKTDAHLWAEKYNGTLDDIFDIQEKVSRAIVDALKLKLSMKETYSITERPFKNVIAYESYLKARHEIDKFTVEGVNRAIQYLESAIKIVGESAVLYAGLAYAWWQHFNIGSKKEYLDNGLKYAEEALRIDPHLSEGHFIKGNLFIFSTLGQIQKGIFHLKRAVEIDPNNREALFHLGAVYLILGKTNDATPLIKKQLSINPLSFYGYWLSSLFHLFEGSNEQALESMAQAYELASGVPAVEFFYALILMYNDRLEEVYNIIDHSKKINPDNIFTYVGVFLKYALQGRKKEALQSVTPQVLKWSSNDLSNPWGLVLGYSLIGEKDKALDLLEKWVQLGFVNYPFFSKDPFLENIRGEERFKKLIKRVKQEWENFEV